MPSHRFAVIAFAILILGAASAGAQQPGGIDVTPYVAVGSSGAAPVGTLVTFPLARALSVEADVAYRRGEGRIHALSTSASLLWFPPRVGRATSFVASGVGLSQFGAPVVSAGSSAIGTQSRTALTMNLGGGLKIPMNGTAALRTDARWEKRFGREGSEQFRVAQGVSLHVGSR